MTFVNHRGETVDPFARAEMHPRPMAFKPTPLVRVYDAAEAMVSYGFAVLGYAPNTADVIERQWKFATEEYAREPEGKLDPGQLPTFTESWFRKNPPRRVRSKPYELRSAADECAALAEKCGWTRVRVDEILKG